MADYSKLRALREKLEKRVELENKREKYKKKIKEEQTLSAFKKAKGAFSLPFKKSAFENLVMAMITLLCTIIFASCSGAIVIAMLFCAVVDVLYVPLYFVFFPFLMLYFIVFKGLRIKILEGKLEKVRKTLSKGKSSKALRREIEECEKVNSSHSSSSSYSSSSYSNTPSSDVTSTEYYKEAVDKYYRTYMGFPPKDENKLPDYATDTTLDMHPGDY